MNEKDFEEFWKEYGADYIANAKSIAMADFKVLSKTRLGKFVTNISIGTDDDFQLEGGTSFTVYGDTKKEILKNTISFLRNLKFANVPSWGKEPNGNIKDSYSSKWNWVKEEAIKRLEEGETSFSFGGNQTIDLFISENVPQSSLLSLKSVSLKKKI